MQIILLQNIKKVGQRGEIATVADGYAQNVLIPKRLALPATPANLKKAEKAEAQKADKRAMDETLAAKALSRLDGKTLTLKVKANEAGGLFEAVRERQVVDAISADFGISLPETVLKLPGPVKKLGAYEVGLISGNAQAKVYLQLLSL